MATGLAVASIGLGVLGSVKDFQAIGRASQTNERIFKRNRQLAGISKEEARKKGARDINQLLVSERRAIGAQRAALAAQGLDVDIGVGSDVILDTQRAIGQDINTVRNNTARAIWGYENEVSTLELQSRLETAAARDAQVATILSGVGRTIDIGFSTGLFTSQRKPPSFGGAAGSSGSLSGSGRPAAPGSPQAIATTVRFGLN